jgi:hypothetical protein
METDSDLIFKSEKYPDTAVVLEFEDGSGSGDAMLQMQEILKEMVLGREYE